LNTSKNNIQLAIVASVLIVATIGSIYTIQPAHAVTKFENCLTRQANHYHILSYQSVVFCFNSQFKTMPNIH
jgi:hypothetical protein